ncbi:hypothetical protein [Actinospica acidithermotolerans]|nr:hypothetical protein [Actinospica acidithermotolerans]
MRNRPFARPTSTTASRSPAINASGIERPEAPSRSVSTIEILI